MAVKPTQKVFEYFTIFLEFVLHDDLKIFGGGKIFKKNNGSRCLVYYRPDQK